MYSLAVAALLWTTANSVATGDQDHSAVAADRNGRVAVVWEDDRDTTAPENDNHSDVYLRLFQYDVPVFERKLSAGGTSGTDWKHVNPDVGIDERGNTVVVWAEDGDGNGVFNIVYRVFTPTGTQTAGAQVHASAAGDQIRPAVAVDPDGTPGSSTAVAFTVVWEDLQNGADTVRAAGFTSATATRAYEVTASQLSGAHHRPDVAVSASGDAIIVWEQDADGDGAEDIGLVRLAKANGAVLTARRVAHAAGAGRQIRPAVAADFAGDFAVTYQSDQTGTPTVWARSFTWSASARHTEVQAATGTAPSVGLDDQGRVLLGWTASSDNWVRGLNPDGTATGRLGAQPLASTMTGRQDEFKATVSPWNELAVTYTDDNDGNTWDQVLLGTGATNDTSADDPDER